MNESVLVWGGVAVLVLIVVILYCLWRLLTRESGGQGPGGVTVHTDGRSDRVGTAGTADADPELAGIDLEAARTRARAAARQTADTPQPATAALVDAHAGDDIVVAPTADPAPLGAGTTDAATDLAGWAMPSAGVGPAAAGIGPAPAAVKIGGPGPDVVDPLHTTHHDDSRS